MATYVHTLDAMWVEIFFYSGLGLAAVGQIAAYLDGERTAAIRSSGRDRKAGRHILP